MTEFVYLFVGGPQHGQLIAMPEYRESIEYVMAPPLPQNYVDGNRDKKLEYEKIIYRREIVGSTEESKDDPGYIDQRRLLVMVAPDVIGLSPEAKNMILLAALLHICPGVTCERTLDYKLMGRPA